jgi:hypothetical protein
VQSGARTCRVGRARAEWGAHVQSGARTCRVGGVNRVSGEALRVEASRVDSGLRAGSGFARAGSASGLGVACRVEGGGWADAVWWRVRAEWKVPGAEWRVPGAEWRVPGAEWRVPGWARRNGLRPNTACGVRPNRGGQASWAEGLWPLVRYGWAWAGGGQVVAREEAGEARGEARHGGEANKAYQNIFGARRSAPWR